MARLTTKVRRLHGLNNWLSRIEWYQSRNFQVKSTFLKNRHRLAQTSLPYWQKFPKTIGAHKDIILWCFVKWRISETQISNEELSIERRERKLYNSFTIKQEINTEKLEWFSSNLTEYFHLMWETICPITETAKLIFSLESPDLWHNSSEMKPDCDPESKIALQVIWFPWES